MLNKPGSGFQFQRPEDRPGPAGPGQAAEAPGLDETHRGRPGELLPGGDRRHAGCQGRAGRSRQPAIRAWSWPAGWGPTALLRERLADGLSRHGATVYYPRTEFCTDNAAMIAFTGCLRLAAAPDAFRDLYVSGPSPLAAGRTAALTRGSSRKNDGYDFSARPPHPHHRWHLGVGAAHAADRQHRSGYGHRYPACCAQRSDRGHAGLQGGNPPHQVPWWPIAASI